MRGIADEEEIPFRALLVSLGVSHATTYRSLKPKDASQEAAPQKSIATHPRALSPVEVNEVVSELPQKSLNWLCGVLI